MKINMAVKVSIYLEKNISIFVVIGFYVPTNIKHFCYLIV